MSTIREESVARMGELSFGDPVTNICAGERNPQLHSYFVGYVVDCRKNRFGLVHKSHWAKCTDKKGKFWKTDIDVIHLGHLDAETRDRLFAPVWQAKYGEKSESGITPGGIARDSAPSNTQGGTE